MTDLEDRLVAIVRGYPDLMTVLTRVRSMTAGQNEKEPSYLLA